MKRIALLALLLVPANAFARNMQLPSPGAFSLPYDATGLYLDEYLICTPAATSDVAPTTLVAHGQHAYAQATGANQTGGVTLINGGLGTYQIVCSDRTIGDQDLVHIIIDSVDTSFTESSDFDCEGTASNEVCCDNLGVAIVAAAIQVTPDCATTAGTCYLTPDLDVLSLDISVTDGAANGVFATMVEGATGNVSMQNGIFYVTSAGAFCDVTLTSDDIAVNNDIVVTDLCSCADVTASDMATTKRSSYTIPATITVALDAATINLENGDLQILDMEGSDADGVTVTISNPTAGQAWVLKVIQDGEASTTTFSPLLYWAGGTAPTITTTDNAIDLISCVYDGAKHLCSITQDLKTAP